MNENEIRLNADNIRLMEENAFLRTMLNRLISMPINDELKTLDYRLNNLEQRTRKIEEKGNKANM